MTIDRSDASASLNEIDAVQKKTREVLIYSGSSISLLIWGGLVTCGYVFTHFAPGQAGPVWLLVFVIGLASGFGIRAWRARTKTNVWDARIHYALIVMVCFGAYWATLISPARYREIAAFWPTLFMFGYVIAGFWVGKFFTYCGVIVTALTIVGYFWLGPWFYLWMAAVSGGGMIAGGLWLRRLG
jgi:hypothetical protein